LAFIDDDDRWDPVKVGPPRLPSLTRIPDVGLVTCDPTALKSDTGGSTPLPFRGADRVDADHMLWANFRREASPFVMVPPATGRARAHDRTRPSPAAEDWDLWLRCSRLAPIGRRERAPGRLRVARRAPDSARTDLKTPAGLRASSNQQALRFDVIARAWPSIAPHPATWTSGSGCGQAGCASVACGRLADANPAAGRRSRRPYWSSSSCARQYGRLKPGPRGWPSARWPWAPDPIWSLTCRKRIGNRPTLVPPHRQRTPSQGWAGHDVFLGEKNLAGYEPPAIGRTDESNETRPPWQCDRARWGAPRWAPCGRVTSMTARNPVLPPRGPPRPWRSSGARVDQVRRARSHRSISCPSLEVRDRWLGHHAETSNHPASESSPNPIFAGHCRPG